jgi:predicted ribosomally synthesized peptide with nif11-like leader
MNDNIKKFLDAVKGNAELQEKLNGKDEAGFITAAKEAGFDITAEDLRFLVTNGSVELSDDDLASVAGGQDPHPIVIYKIITH